MTTGKKTRQREEKKNTSTIQTNWSTKSNKIEKQPREEEKKTHKEPEFEEAANG